MDIDDFETVDKNRQVSINDSSKTVIKLSTTEIYLPNRIYEELRKPDNIKIELNTKRAAIKLSGVPKGEGYIPSLTKASKLRVGDPVWRFKVPQGKRPKMVLENYPLGYYKAIGGGVFEFLSKEFPD